MPWWIAIALFSTVLFAGETQIYYVPVPPHARKAVPATHSLPPATQILLWNPFGEGQYGARVIEFERAPTERWIRTRTQRVRLFEDLAFGDAQDQCDLLLTNSVMKRIERTALLEMDRAHYLPPETSDPLEHFLEAAHDLGAEQVVYLESTVWMPLQRVLNCFGGQIPWERIVAVRAPSGRTWKEILAHLEKRDLSLEVQIRKATLRLVGGQSFSPLPVTLNTSPWSFSDLPFERFLKRKSVERSFTPLAFELTRLSQVDFTHREGLSLVPFAAGVAYHSLFAARVYGSWQPFPSREVGVFGMSFESRRTELFQRALAMRPHLQMGNSSVLSTSLFDLGNATPLAATLDAHSSLLQVEGALLDGFRGVEALHYYRTSFRRDLDLRVGPRTLSLNGPVIVRHGRRLGEFLFSERLRAFPETSRIAMLEVLGRAPSIPAPEDVFFFTDDSSQLDALTLSPSPVIVSNLSEREAIRDPRYLHYVFTAIRRNYPLELLHASGEISPLLVFTKSDRLSEALRGLGFQELRLSLSKGRAFQIELARLPTYPVDEPVDLFPGYWFYYRLLQDISGL